MGEYSNGDIQRIHERIDELGKDLRDEMAESTKQVVNLCIAMGKVETKLSMLPAPARRPCSELKNHLEDHKDNKRPCPDLTKHLASHKEIRALWQKPLVSKLIDLALLAITFAVALGLGRWQSKAQSEQPQPETRVTSQP